MDTCSRKEDAWIFSKRGAPKVEVKRKNRKEGMGVREKTRGRKRGRISKMLGGNEGKEQRRKNSIGMGRGEEKLV